MKKFVTEFAHRLNAAPIVVIVWLFLLSTVTFHLVVLPKISTEFTRQPEEILLERAIAVRDENGYTFTFFLFREDRDTYSKWLLTVWPGRAVSEGSVVPSQMVMDSVDGVAHPGSSGVEVVLLYTVEKSK